MPPTPLLGHSQPEAFLTSFTPIFTSEELNGEITGVGNPTEPFALSCCSEGGRVSFSEDGERLWTVGADQLSSGEEDLNPVIKEGRIMRQLGQREWGLHFHSLRSILYRKRPTARVSGSRAG